MGVAQHNDVPLRDVVGAFETTDRSHRRSRWATARRHNIWKPMPAAIAAKRQTDLALPEAAEPVHRER
jgi:hypothetical protein